MRTDAARTRPCAPDVDLAQTFRRDVLSLMALLGSATAIGTAGAPIIGSALALGGAFSALLRWGPTAEQARDAAFGQFMDELRAQGVCQKDVAKLADVDRSHPTQAAMFHAIFPEISLTAFTVWMKEIESADKHRLLDFGRIVLAVRGALNLSPHTDPDEVLRSLPVRYWALNAERAMKAQFDPVKVGQEKPVATLTREALTWLYGGFRPTSVDPLPVRAAREESRAVMNHDAADWLKLNDRRMLDLKCTGDALDNGAVSVAQRELRQRKAVLLAQKQAMKAGTESRQLDRRIQVLELSDRRLTEPNEEKRGVLTRELAALRKDIALWSLPKDERVAMQKRQRDEFAGFEPPTLIPPRHIVPILPIAPSVADDVFDVEPPLEMTTSAAARHGGMLQTVPRAMGYIGSAVRTLFSWGSTTHDATQTTFDEEAGRPLTVFAGVDPLADPLAHDLSLSADTGGASTNPKLGLSASVFGLAATSGILYTGYEWMRPEGAPPSAGPGEGSNATATDPALTTSQQALIAKLADRLHAGDDGVWGSTLEAIAGVVSNAPDPHAPDVVERVAALLRHDFNEIAAIQEDEANDDADDFSEFDVPDVAPDHRRLRRSVDSSTTAQRLTQMRDVAAGDRADTETVIDIIDAVDQYRHSVSGDDEKRLFGALQSHWRSDPSLEWLARAPESEQKLWLHYVQKARDRFDKFAQAIHHAQPLDVVYVAFAQSGLQGDPASWTVTYPAPVEGISPPIIVQQRLIDACLSGDSRRDPETFEGFLNGQPVTAAQTALMRTLLRGQACRTTPQARFKAIESSIPSLQTPFATFLEGELHRDILEAKLKGHLTGGRDAWIQGLRLMQDAMHDAPDVEVGALRLAPPGMSEIPLLPWLVFARKDNKRKDADHCVVLYRPEEKAWSVFDNRQALYQYLDLPRLRKSLSREMEKPTPSSPATVTVNDDALRTLPQVALEAVAPRDRQALRKFLDSQSENPAHWKPEFLQFSPYDGARLPIRLEAWARRQLDRLATQLDPMTKVPGLPAQLADALALDQRFQAYEAEHLPPLREFTRRTESDKLTRGLRGVEGKSGDGLPDLGAVDADSVSILFNGQNMTVTDWVLEGYRHHGDGVFASTNNFQRDAQIVASDAAVAERLSTPDFKESLERNLRSTYAGDAYIAHLRQWLTSDDPTAETFRHLTQVAIRAKLQVTISMDTASGRLPPADAAWLNGLVGGLPGRVAVGDAFISELYVAGRRIPGVLVLSQRKRVGPDTVGKAPLRTDYVWLPEGPYGSELLPLTAYREGLHRTPYDDDLLGRVLTKDRKVVDDALRYGKGIGASQMHTVALNDFGSFGDQRLLDRIDETQESTTSRSEVVWEQVVKGVRLALLPVCIAPTGGAGIALCGVGTAALAGVDLMSAYENIQRGEIDAALLDVAFLWADALDIGAGLRIMDPRRLLAWAGKSHFANAADVTEVLNKVKGQRAAFDDLGHLRDTLATHGIDVGNVDPTPVRTGPVSGGVRYERDGRSYIRDGGRTFEVFSDNAWATIRVRDPQRANAPGIPVTFRDGRWQWDDAGLLGGGPTAAKRARTIDASSFLLDLGLAPRDVNVFLNAFVFPPGVAAMRRIEVAQEIHATGKVPGWAFNYVRASERGRVFGWTGQSPAEVLGKAGTVGDAQQSLYRSEFEFPKPEMWAWFDLEAVQGGKPMWAAAFARSYEGMFSAEEVLVAKGVFEDIGAARRYLNAFESLDTATRHRLVTDRMSGRTPSWAYPYIKPNDAWLLLSRDGLSAEQILVATGDFLSEADVHAYLGKFEFPLGALGAERRTWLAQRRLITGSTPREFAIYLREPISMEVSGAKMLANAGIFNTLKEAGDYLAQFRPLTRVSGKLSVDEAKQIALTRILEGAPPAWAFPMVEPENVLALFGPNRIPRGIESLSVLQHTSATLVLPDVMPHLKSLRIEGNVDLTLPKSLPSVERFVVKRAVVPREFRLPVMGRAITVVVDGTNANTLRIPYECQSLTMLGVDGNLSLRSFEIESMPEGAGAAEPSQLLSIEINNNPRLQQVDLPLDLPDLGTLNLARNDLTRLPLTGDHRLPSLMRLNLARNRIATLTDVPALPGLQTLTLTTNQFANIPHVVASWRSVVPTHSLFGRPLIVDMAGNPIPEQRILEWQQRPAVPNGAQVYFSMGNTFQIAARPLADAVSDWFDPAVQAMHRQLWEGFAKETNAPDFSQFLDRLRRTVNYESASFRSRARKFITELEADRSFREKIFPVSLCSTESCEDRVTYTFGQMKQAWLAHAVTKGVYDDDPKLFKATMLGLYRLHLLELIAREKVPTLAYVDEIEVFLAYQVKLRGALALPTDATEMRYFGVSGVTEADLKAAKERVLREEEKDFPKYLANSGPVQALLERRWPEEFAAARDQLTDSMDPDVFQQRVKDHLRDDGLDNDADALRGAGPGVLQTRTYEAYRPLIDRLLAMG